MTPTARAALDACTHHFVSGLASAAEVRGVLLGGWHPGVTASTVSAGAIEALFALESLEAEVFLDSGAYGASGPVDWGRCLELAARLARVYGGRLLFVAPDDVGHVEASLALLRRHASAVRGVLGSVPEGVLAPRLVVPLHGPAARWSDLAQASCDALGLSEARVTWGLPLAAPQAPGVGELSAFARSCQVDGRFHLLGRSPFSRRYRGVREVLLRACPEALVTSDAVRLRALVGRASGLRRLTRALDVEAAARPAEALAARKARAVMRVLGDEQLEYLTRAGWYDEELFDAPQARPGCPVQLALLEAEP